MPATVLEMLLPSEADKLTKGGRDAAFFIVSTGRFTNTEAKKGEANERKRPVAIPMLARRFRALSDPVRAPVALPCNRAGRCVARTVLNKYNRPSYRRGTLGTFRFTTNPTSVGLQSI